MHNSQQAKLYLFKSIIILIKVHKDSFKTSNWSQALSTFVLIFENINKMQLFLPFQPCMGKDQVFLKQTNILLFKASALWADAFYKLKCPSVCPSVCLLSVCLCVHFWGTVWTSFCPHFRQMSNIFRDLESLGKSNGKKWSQIGTFLFGSGLKLWRKKKFVFFGWFCLTKHGRNHTSRWIKDLWSKSVLLILAYL